MKYDYLKKILRPVLQINTWNANFLSISHQIVTVSFNSQISSFRSNIGVLRAMTKEISIITPMVSKHVRNISSLVPTIANKSASCMRMLGTSEAFARAARLSTGEAAAKFSAAGDSVERNIHAQLTELVSGLQALDIELEEIGQCVIFADIVGTNVNIEVARANLPPDLANAFEALLRDLAASCAMMRELSVNCRGELRNLQRIITKG